MFPPVAYPFFLVYIHKYLHDAQFWLSLVLKALHALEWDESKNRHNLRKHGIRFQTTALVFEDQNAGAFLDDRSEDVGKLAVSAVVVLVVHTVRESGYEEVVRMISARLAAKAEWKMYEEA